MWPQSTTGPFSDDWQATDTTEPAAIVHHPCGEQRLFNINTEPRVSAGSPDPATTTGSARARPRRPDDVVRAPGALSRDVPGGRTTLSGHRGRVR
ncbi:DUF4360 domain-containing protein [Saccharothrix xinjiangensis]|uniref:DUF4360 domain-containing protein n=1 Tax=Saccharothrix xinjiangensis TaxID=204798 RepID=A0ABV9Y3M2_9PSEU